MKKYLLAMLLVLAGLIMFLLLPSGGGNARPAVSPSGAHAADSPGSPAPGDSPNISDPIPSPPPTPPETLLDKLSGAPYLSGGDIPLRKFPYPYLAMLAICSDCDSVTQSTFERAHRFFNTFENTEYGVGLGLDVADTFFVYNGSNLDAAANLMTYCEGVSPDTTKDAAMIKKYYNCGWIDGIHAFGDFSSSTGSKFTRNLAIKAWELLDAAEIAPKIWIDHGTYTNVQNFGAYNPNNASSYQRGDDPASPYYHTDITLAHSVRYVWYSRNSESFASDFPMELKTLRDGQTVWSFKRYTSEKTGNVIDWTWRPNRIRDQLTPARLDAMAANGQFSIVAQHIDVFQEAEQLTEADISALRDLARRCHGEKTILVARTSRLLDYAAAYKCLVCQTAYEDGCTAIRINTVNDPVAGTHTPTVSELSGITFYTDNPEKTFIYIGDKLISPDNLSVNPPDNTGRLSISIKWFASDTNDYTIF